MHRGEVAAEEGLQHASVARGLEPSGKWGPFNEAALFLLTPTPRLEKAAQ